MSKKVLVLVLAFCLIFSTFGIFVNAAEYNEKFDYSTGADMKTALLEKWNYVGGAELGNSNGSKLDNGTYWMAFTDALYLKWKNALDTYEFKVDVKGGTYNEHVNPAMILLRTTGTDYFGMAPFEETNSDGSAGHSGVIIKLHEKEAWIYVKKYDASVTYSSVSTQNKATYTSHEVVKVTLPNSKNVNTEFVNFHVTDDGSKMLIYADGVLIASVEMSEPQDITMHDTDIGNYFTKAVIKNELTEDTKTVTDARIANSDATVSLSVRGCGMWVDNISMKEEFAAPNPQTNDTSAFFIVAVYAVLAIVAFKKKLAV